MICTQPQRHHSVRYYYETIAEQNNGLHSGRVTSTAWFPSETEVSRTCTDKHTKHTHTHKLTKCRVRVFPGFLKLQCQRVCQRQAFITQRSAAENDRAGFLDITQCSKKTHSWLCNQRFINKMHKYRISVYAVAFTSLNLFCGLDVDF